MELQFNPYRFDAGQDAVPQWPMAPMGALATELMAVLLSHVASSERGFAQLEHEIATVDYDASEDESMLDALAEVTSRHFDMPVEGGVQPLRMIAETYLNPTRLLFVLDEQYASYLRFLTASASCGPRGGWANYHLQINATTPSHAHDR